MSDENKILELKDDELEKVVGGCQPNSKDLGSKYKANTRVKCYILHGDYLVQTYATIVDVYWSDEENQYMYVVDNETTRYVHDSYFEVDELTAGRRTIKEEYIIYDL